MRLYVIYTESKILLSKKLYGSWREIQDEYDDYKTSLGPWDVSEVKEYLEQEYSDIVPPAAEQLLRFVSSTTQVCEVERAQPPQEAKTEKQT